MPSLLLSDKEELERLASRIRECTKCPLHESRKISVPGDGPARAEVMIVGEGPGAQEDATGHPFVGSAGQLLSRLLESIGLDRSQVFITNIVKCRPPNNRPPRKEETAECTRSYLEPQIRLIGPRIIVPLGTPAIKHVLGEDYVATGTHGRLFKRDGRLVLPLFHPAAALYDRSLEATMLEDMKQLKRLLEDESSGKEAELVG